MILGFLLILFWYLCLIMASALITIAFRFQFPNKYKADDCYCDYCGEPIRPKRLANLPIINFILLKGKTNCCGLDLNIINPIAEFSLGTLIFLIFIIGMGI